MKTLDETRWDSFFGRVDSGELIYTCNHMIDSSIFWGALVGCAHCKNAVKNSQVDLPQPEELIKPTPNGKTNRNRILYRQLYLDDPPMDRKEAARFHHVSYERIKQLDMRFQRQLLKYLHKRELERQRRERFREKFGDRDE
jgi:hypothetical protein